MVSKHTDINIASGWSCNSLPHEWYLFCSFSGQLYGTSGLCQREQYLLVNSSDKVVKYSYMNTSSIEFKGILFTSNMNREKHVLCYVRTICILCDQNSARLKIILKKTIGIRCLLGTLWYTSGVLVVCFRALVVHFGMLVVLV